MTEAHARRLLGEAFVGLAVGLTWPFAMIVVAFGLWGERALVAGLFIAAMVATVFVSPGRLTAKLRSGAMAALVGLSMIHDSVFMPNAVGVLVAGSSLMMGAVLLTTAAPSWETAE